MDCRTARDRIASWLEGELARAEAELMEDHLDHCVECHDLAEQLSQQEAVLQLVKPPPLEELESPEFWNRMDAAMAREIEVKEAEDARAARLWRRWLGRRVALPVPLLVAAAALLGLALAWGVGQHQAALTAQAEAEDLGIALEREQRLGAPPSQAVRAGTFRTSVHTPARGNL